METLKALFNNRKIRKFAVEAAAGAAIGLIGLLTDAPGEFYLSDGGVVILLQVRRALRDFTSAEPPK